MKTKPTIHFVYVKGESKAAPICITNQVYQRLIKHYRVKLYDWSERTEIIPEPRDILLGHPHPDPKTIFQISFSNPNFSKRIVLSPLAHKMPEYIAFLDPFIKECDVYLAITGNFWIKTLPESIVSHWADKIEHLDLAVSREDYPTIKEAWGIPGKRRFLYIGSTGKNKGTDLLQKLSIMLPEFEFAWLGYGPAIGGRVKHLGSMDLTTTAAHSVIKEYDFLIHLGRSDANPTTILEALAWGLIPVCTPTSGYIDKPWLVTIPMKLEEAKIILQKLVSTNENELDQLRNAGKEPLDSYFTWDRFFGQILKVIEEPSARAISPNNQILFEKRSKTLASMAQRKFLFDKIHFLFLRIKRRLGKIALWG